MALILVVEQENRYIERIRDALTSEGWQVRAVGGTQEALSTAEREPPQLVLVSRESEGCDRLFQAFSRRTGGPGVVALLPESATDLEEPAADDALAKPFTDQDLRLAVRRGLKPKTTPSPTSQASQPPDGDRQLSAQDIFGDLVAEVESEIQGAGAAASPAPTPPTPTPPRPTTPPRDAPKARDHEAPKRRPRSGELDLEKTLSGLRRDIELGSRPDRPSSTGVPTPGSSTPETPTPETPTAGISRQSGSVRPGTAPRRKKKTDTELDVDALLSETLSGFDLPSKKKKKPAPKPPTGAEPPMAAETPGEAEVSLADLLADEDDVPPPTQVQPPPDLVDPPSATPRPGTGDRRGDGVGAAEPGVVAGGGEPPAPTRAQPSEEPSREPGEERRKPERESGAELRKGPEVREISFSDLSAPSLQEVPEPLTPDPGSGPDIGPELDDLREEMEAGFAAPRPETPRPETPERDELGERSGTGYSLADWLESGEDSMFVPDESPPDTRTETPETPPAAAGDAGPPTSGDLSTPPDRRFGQYTLLDRIAVGGMAEVWKARSTGIEGFQKTVAIKKILPHLTDNDDFVNMFVDEAKLAAQLSHPNIIHIYDLGKIGDHFYIAMEYVEGKNLRALLNESRRKALPLPRGLALLIAARLASALDHAHRKKDFEDRELGLVHRDVSPQNVLISDEGDIKLCDFGIVKAVSKVSQTQMGALKGKLQYMSPEQAWGKDVDGRSDLFSLGAILFEMLTGRRLFAGDSEISVLEAVRQCRVVAPRELVPQIPEKVEAITLKALAMDPGDRYQTAGEMQGELEDVLYSVKPAPSPADLAEFLSRLALAPEADESDLVPPPTAAAEPPADDDTGEGTPRTDTTAERSQEVLSSLPSLGDSRQRAQPESSGSPGTSSSGSATQREPSRPSAPTGTPRPAEATGSGAAPSDRLREAPDDLAATAMPAMADYDLDELEEGGGRGKLWLVLLIVALLAAGAAAFYYLYFVRPPSTSPAPTPEADAPAEQPSPPVPSPLDEVEPETPDDAGDYEGDETEGDQTGETVEGPTAASSSIRPPPTRPAKAAAAPPAEEDSGATIAAAPRTQSPPGPVAGEVAGTRTDSTRTKPRTTATRSPTEPRPTPPGPSRTGPAPAVAAGSREPPSAAATGTSPGAEPDTATEETESRAGPPTPPPTEPSQTPFALRERTSPTSSESRPASLATTEVSAPAAPRAAEPVALRNPPRPEIEPETETQPVAEPEPQPPPEPPVREGDLVGPGPGVTAPVLVRFDKPRYPPLARRMKVEGDVVVSLLVDEEGRVLEARLIQGVREGVGLHQVALDAARRARYRPATKNGVRVKMWTTLKIPFRL